MSNEQATTAGWVHSAGGVRLQVPEGWKAVFEHEHLSALVEVTEEPSSMAPTCIVHDAPGHLDLASWWSALQVGGEGALLLEVEQQPDGFSAVHAVTADELSATGYSRLYHLPGRTLVVSVSFESDRTAEVLPTARTIADSVRVDGLP